MNSNTFDQRLYSAAMKRITELEQELIYARRMLERPYHHFDDPENPCPCCGFYTGAEEGGGGVSSIHAQMDESLQRRTAIKREREHFARLLGVEAWRECEQQGHAPGNVSVICDYCNGTGRVLLSPEEIVAAAVVNRNDLP